mmetsp:Transcript_567/g.875  ORF Transcript_567/g.875 Transcript_567/m.875 type:complete len:173 (-) Transcript_567:332-850(-)|eukprot:CAMPEP_0194238146 /NCGR_PEP_ID=MMETSP0158-20130606/4968_1 /TAXON_ID=33649 /ORGANISM="Thalassionema nitzschioides, Strain L26-B" /LENGTH=172 /DNA_ID=CAMNT_0038972337 /DNA_START=29 /DNA_END=547 /DNA_ORIENTATION=+
MEQEKTTQKQRNNTKERYEWRSAEDDDNNIEDHETSSETTCPCSDDDTSQQSSILDLSHISDPDDEIVFDVEKTQNNNSTPYWKSTSWAQEQYINTMAKNVNVITFGFMNPDKNVAVDDKRDDSNTIIIDEREAQKKQTHDQLLQLSEISEPDDEFLFLSENLNQTSITPFT